MRSKLRSIAPTSALLVVTLLLAGCGAQEAPASGGDTDVTPSAGPQSTDPVPPEEPTTTAATGAPESVVGLAIADLAAREAIPPSDITVEEAGAVTWRDGSIGCAEDGMVYTDALVPGYLIVLAAGGETYEYHQGSQVPAGAAPFYCAKPTEEPLPEQG